MGVDTLRWTGKTLELLDQRALARGLLVLGQRTGRRLLATAATGRSARRRAAGAARCGRALARRAGALLAHLHLDDF